MNRSTHTQVLKALLALCLGTLGCSGNPGDDAPTPGGSPTPSPVPTPFSTVMCDWDEAPPVTDFDPWWYDAVFYEVFVRSFQDSDRDGIGDLPGLISRLDYLNDGNPETHDDLGVTALWLMPVFASPSEHGYSVTDHRQVELDYGTQEDLQDLLDAAHARGMRVILDLPFNHTSSQHPWFEDASSSPATSHRSWYVWSDTGANSDWHRVGDQYYYAAFDGSIPDLNLAEPAVLEELRGIYEHWMSLDLDGFRLDGAKYLVEDGPITEHSERTHCYLQAMRRYFNHHWPQSVLVGEVWDSSEVVSRYFGDGTNELPVAFDFRTSDGIVSSIRGADPAVLHTPLANREGYNPDPRMSGTFLRNHDMDRTGSVLSSPAQLRQAATVLMSLSGPVFLYYGEEIGMTGARGSENHDNARRSPMQWSSALGAGFVEPDVTPWYPINDDYPSINVAVAQTDEDSLLQRTRTLIRLRRDEANRALRHGEFRRINSSPSDTYAFLRGSGEGAILVVLNLSGDAEQEVILSLEGLETWEHGTELLSGAAVTQPVSGLWSAGRLEPNGSRWIRLQ